MAYQLPPLPYGYGDLEPYIDEQTMHIHHGKHHQAYVDNLNKAIAGSAVENLSLEELMAQISKQAPAVRNNGGGHYNHSLFWTVMGPKAGGSPSGDFANTIEKAFGSYDAFKEKFNSAGTTRFGSGWAWLIVNGSNELEVCSTPNQDNPLMDVADVKGTPILGCDVWEHAYYLKYQNKRPDYLNAFWNVVNWSEVERRYLAAKR